MNSIVTKYDYALEFLEDILHQTPLRPTHLLICSTREDFFEQILAAVDQHDTPDRPGIAPPHEERGPQHETTTTLTARHTLLSRTLHVLNASHHVQLTFCPTLTVLRGYLSGYTPDVTDSRQPLGALVILNLLATHYGTSEFTLQGLSQTFATAVSAAHRSSRALKLVECKDIRDTSNVHRGSALWQAEVQLLSAAIKIGQAGQNWGRRSIPVARIASRWFKFEEATKTPEGKRRLTGLTRPMHEDEMLV